MVHYTSKDNEQGFRTNLDFLNESRLTITVRHKAYQLKITHYHNAKVKDRRFKFGYLVLRKLKVVGNKKSKDKLVGGRNHWWCNATKLASK